MKIISKQY